MLDCVIRVGIPVGVRKFSPKCPDRPWGPTQPRTQWVDCFWNVMAHAQKPDFVLRRNGRVHLNRQGRQFSRLLAAEVRASAVVMLLMLDTPCSRGGVKGTGCPLHSAVSPSLPLRALPCAITFQLDSTRVLNGGGRLKRSGHDIDQSPPSSTEVKNEWSYTSTPLYALMAWTGRSLPSTWCVEMLTTYTRHGQFIACVAFRSTCRVGMLDMQCTIQLRLVSFRATYALINIQGVAVWRLSCVSSWDLPRSCSPAAQIK